MAKLNFIVETKKYFLFSIFNKYVFGLFKFKFPGRIKTRYFYVAFNKVGWIE